VKSVVVIIVNWNGKSYIGECLEALRHQDYPNFTVMFLDNASSDGSVDFVRSNFPEVQIIRLDQNLGFAKANNLALEAIAVPYVALLNNDTVVDPGWLESLVQALDENPAAGSAASRMLLYDQPHITDRAGDIYCRSGTAMLRGRGEPADAYNRQGWVFGACAGAALYRTGMLKDIGLFDEDFFLLYEDVDLSFRAQLQGYKCLYVPEAVVYHHGSKTIGDDSPTSIFYSHRNLEWVYIQNMPAMLIWKSMALHLLYNLAAFSFFSYRGHMRTFLKAKISAIKRMKSALRKRRQVLARKVVSDDYLWQMMEKERFLPRLARRFNKR
jgi:GT2 family glycosyltransferase